jgi:hypothetical protein
MLVRGVDRVKRHVDCAPGLARAEVDEKRRSSPRTPSDDVISAAPPSHEISRLVRRLAEYADETDSPGCRQISLATPQTFFAMLPAERGVMLLQRRKILLCE